MASYKIIGQRILRKYTEPKKSPTYSASIEAHTIVDSLCAVPWKKVAARDATMTYHTEENVGTDENKISGLDMNVQIRDQFDAALFCADHTGGQHRAYANAAVYHYVFPDETLPKLTKLTAKVTSDPYNSAGARIAILTNATGEIPTNCNACRTGDAHADGVAPRTVAANGNWFPTMADCVFSANPGDGETALPAAGLQLQKHLFVFVLMESYSTVRGNWLEGCSYIRNLVEIETNAAVTGWTDGDTYDLAENASIEFNVCRGGVLPPLVGEVSGVQSVDVSFDGVEDRSQGLYRPGTLDENAAIGLRTAFGLFYKGNARNVSVDALGISGKARPGASFLLSANGSSGAFVNSWRTISKTFTAFSSAAFNGVFVACDSEYLFRSDDYGATWERFDFSPRVAKRALAFGAGVLVAGSEGHGLFYSSDLGSTWENCETNEGSFGCVAFGNGVFVAGSTGVDATGIYYSTDGGRTWTQSSIGSGSLGSLAFGDGVFVAGSLDDHGLLYSTDGGVTWTRSSMKWNNFKSLSYGGGVFVAGSNGLGIFYSEDGGVTWTRSEITEGLVRSLSYGDGVFVAGIDGSGLLYSTDGGRTWTQSSIGSGDIESISYGGGTFIAFRFSGSDCYKSGEYAFNGWRITSSVMFIRTSVPIYFTAKKVRLDWSEWDGTATAGAKFNVWMKRGSFEEEYDAGIVRNSLIYTAKADKVGDYDLVGVIDATQLTKTATFDLAEPIAGDVVTFLLSAFVSQDEVNPSSSFVSPLGAAVEQSVDIHTKKLLNDDKGWRPDITLLA